MKKELIKFVMERADKEYNDDFPISHIPDWINEFFDQYQPERSKREDEVIDPKKSNFCGEVMRMTRYKKP